VCGKYNAIGGSLYDCSAGVSGDLGDADGDDAKVIQNRPFIRVGRYGLARRTSYIDTANMLNFYTNLRKIMEKSAFLLENAQYMYLFDIG